MFPTQNLVAALGVCLTLAACGRSEPRDATAATAPPELRAPDAGYVTPPTPDAVRLTARGVSLSGSASKGARVRLATPSGATQEALVGKDGRWTINLPPLAEPAVYGLSVVAGERQAQAEGYVLLTPGGPAALLRAGAGAQRIDRTAGYGIRAVDFDRQGGAVVTARTPADAMVVVQLDGRQAAESRADAQGRYEVGLLGRVTPGRHRLQISGPGFSDAVDIQVATAAPLVQGPLRSQVTASGLKVDWMTPGGGVQSTILVN